MWGKSKLAQIVCSGSLAPHFVNNDDVTTEITCSTMHELHEVLAWLRGTLSRKQWHITAASWLCLLSHPLRGENIAWVLLWLLHQPGERLYYGCCASQERIVSAVPMASSLLPALLTCALPTLYLTNNILSEIQQDNWCSEQDQWYTKNPRLFSLSSFLT